LTLRNCTVSAVRLTIRTASECGGSETDSEGMRKRVSNIIGVMKTDLQRLS
jgi:hypothetical protein